MFLSRLHLSLFATLTLPFSLPLIPCRIPSPSRYRLVFSCSTEEVFPLVQSWLAPSVQLRPLETISKSWILSDGVVSVFAAFWRWSGANDDGKMVCKITKVVTLLKRFDAVLIFKDDMVLNWTHACVCVCVFLQIQLFLGPFGCFWTLMSIAYSHASNPISLSDKPSSWICFLSISFNFSEDNTVCLCPVLLLLLRRSGGVPGLVLMREAISMEIDAEGKAQTSLSLWVVKE